MNFFTTTFVTGRVDIFGMVDIFPTFRPRTIFVFFLVERIHRSVKYRNRGRRGRRRSRLENRSDRISVLREKKNTNVSIYRIYQLYYILCCRRYRRRQNRLSKSPYAVVIDSCVMSRGCVTLLCNLIFLSSKIRSLILLQIIPVPERFIRAYDKNKITHFQGYFT